MPGLDTILDQIVNGLTIGAIYALIALGYTLVYGILFMINFAHGEIFMFGSFTGFAVLTYFVNIGFAGSYPAPAILAAFLAAMVVCALLGALLERIAYRPLRKAQRLAPLISAIGASIFLQNVMMLIVKARMQVYPDVLPERFIQVGPVSISYFQIFIILASLFLLGGLFLGLTEALGVLVMPAEYKDVIAFGLLVLVLIFRPRGILGEVVSERT